MYCEYEGKNCINCPFNLAECSEANCEYDEAGNQDEAPLNTNADALRKTRIPRVEVIEPRSFDISVQGPQQPRISPLK